MKLLAHIMRLSRGHNCWWLDQAYDRIMWHAHRIGLVYRASVSQVHWTDMGVELFRKYNNIAKGGNDHERIN